MIRPESDQPAPSKHITGEQAWQLGRGPGITFLPLVWPHVLGAASRLLGALIAVADKSANPKRDGRSTYKSVPTLAAMAGIPERTCRDYIQLLEELAILRTVPRPNGATPYRVLRRSRKWWKKRKDRVLAPLWAVRILPNWEDLFLYSHLLLKCHKQIWTSQTISGLAKDTELNRRTIVKSIKSLIEKGLIERIDDGTNSTFALLYPRWVCTVRRPLCMVRRRVCTVRRPLCTARRPLCMARLRTIPLTVL